MSKNIPPDELAFANEQLAGMLKSGLPLEGSLRELAGSMKQGPLRGELEALEADLAQGAPLAEALEARDLPPLYTTMLQVGAAANNLPAVLQWLADYYARANTTWLRLKGLLVYPLLVLIAATVMSAGMYWVTHEVIAVTEMESMLGFSSFGAPDGKMVLMRLCHWGPPLMLALLLLVAVGLLAVPKWRRKMHWKLPGFREANQSRLAGALALLLRGGVPLGEALALVRELEKGTPAEPEIDQWLEQLSQGEAKPAAFMKPGRIFPSLFTWVVRSSGENVEQGFARAAEIFHARQVHHTEMMLYAALPMAILVLGALIVVQVIPMMMINVQFIDALGM